MDSLSVRQLNRASLHRQLLLARADVGVEHAVAGLGGMQSQAPNAPYVGLWSRLAGFRPEVAVAGLVERRLVRTPLLRGTIHLIGADDTTAWYPLIRPVLERGFAGNWARRLPGVDIPALLADCAALLTQPHTRAELGDALAPRWPGADPTAMAYAATYLLPVVQIPPRGVWGQTGPPRWLGTATWLGDLGTPDSSPDRMVLRYLAAFGPATVRDIQTWCGLTRLREVVARLPLRHFDGGLLDIEDGALPDPDTPAPPRFLPEYDNLLLSYADRSRVGAHDRTVPLLPGNGGVAGTLLVDDFWHANWLLARENTLVVETFGPLTKKDRANVIEEGLRLLGFIAPDANRPDVVISP